MKKSRLAHQKEKEILEMINVSLSRMIEKKLREKLERDFDSL